MNLSANTIGNISSEKVTVPAAEIFELPEKVLQFGTGVLLRGLPDYFIDKANRQGIFNGRIVVVKSTDRGDTAAFDEQNGLYTLCVRGIDNGKKVEKNIINSSISRVLNASDEWKEILKCAHNKALQVIISNTTEVGIELKKDDIRKHPPISFPGKLLAFLQERFIAFNGSEQSGFVIVPTELIPDNGKKLASIILELAHLNNRDNDFIEWIRCCNYFCNSLVDRIVTGMPDEKIKSAIEDDLGYKDKLLTVCESYRLWAIEGDDHIKNILSFAQSDKGIIIEPDITLYRELKLRLLNGTHTLSCGIAFLTNVDTVKNAMEDQLMEEYISGVMGREIAVSISYKISSETIQDFVAKVLDRFRNPHIDHHWKSITLNYSSKMKMRCIPLLLNYYSKNNSAPELFALGFAAYIFFMRAVIKKGNEYFGILNGKEYLIQDETAEKFYSVWQNANPGSVVMEVLKNYSLWDSDLSILPGFAGLVSEKLNSIINDGMLATLEKQHRKKFMNSES